MLFLFEQFSQCILLSLNSILFYTVYLNYIDHQPVHWLLKISLKKSWNSVKQNPLSILAFTLRFYITGSNLFAEMKSFFLFLLHIQQIIWHNVFGTHYECSMKCHFDFIRNFWLAWCSKLCSLCYYPQLVSLEAFSHYYRNNDS